MQRWVSAGLVALVGGVLILLPVLALRRRGAEWRWPVLGVVSWVIALAFKFAVGAVLALALPGLLAGASPAGAASWGFVSAAAELGIAAAFLRGRRLRVPDVLAFGAGIGSFEAAFVLGPFLLGVVFAPSETAPGLATTLLVLAERAITLVGHVASRVLVYEAVAGGRPLAGIVALVLFVAVDGTATHGSNAGWEWKDPAVHGGFLAFCAVVGAIEVLVARALWRPATPSPPGAAPARP